MKALTSIGGITLVVCVMGQSLLATPPRTNHPGVAGFPENPAYGYSKWDSCDASGNTKYDLIYFMPVAPREFHCIVHVRVWSSTQPLLCDSNVAWYFHRSANGSHVVCQSLSNSNISDTVLSFRESESEGTANTPWFHGASMEAKVDIAAKPPLLESELSSVFSPQPVFFRLRDSVIAWQMSDNGESAVEFRQVMSNGTSLFLSREKMEKPLMTLDLMGILTTTFIRDDSLGRMSTIITALSFENQMPKRLRSFSVPSRAWDIRAIGSRSPIFYITTDVSPPHRPNLYEYMGGLSRQVTRLDHSFTFWPYYILYPDSIVYWTRHIEDTLMMRQRVIVYNSR